MALLGTFLKLHNPNLRKTVAKKLWQFILPQKNCHKKMAVVLISRRMRWIKKTLQMNDYKGVVVSINGKTPHAGALSLNKGFVKVTVPVCFIRVICQNRLVSAVIKPRSRIGLKNGTIHCTNCCCNIVCVNSTQ